MSSFFILLIAGICYSGGLYLLIKKMLKEESEILDNLPEDYQEM